MDDCFHDELAGIGCNLHACLYLPSNVVMLVYIHTVSYTL